MYRFVRESKYEVPLLYNGVSIDKACNNWPIQQNRGRRFGRLGDGTAKGMLPGCGCGNNFCNPYITPDLKDAKTYKSVPKFSTNTEKKIHDIISHADELSLQKWLRDLDTWYKEKCSPNVVGHIKNGDKKQANITRAGGGDDSNGNNNGNGTKRAEFKAILPLFNFKLKNQQSIDANNKFANRRSKSSPACRINSERSKGKVTPKEKTCSNMMNKRQMSMTPHEKEPSKTSRWYITKKSSPKSVDRESSLLRNLEAAVRDQNRIATPKRYQPKYSCNNIDRTSGRQSHNQNNNSKAITMRASETTYIIKSPRRKAMTTQQKSSMQKYEIPIINVGYHNAAAAGNMANAANVVNNVIGLKAIVDADTTAGLGRDVVVVTGAKKSLLNKTTNPNFKKIPNRLVTERRITNKVFL